MGHEHNFLWLAENMNICCTILKSIEMCFLMLLITNKSDKAALV